MKYTIEQIKYYLESCLLYEVEGDKECKELNTALLSAIQGLESVVCGIETVLKEREGKI
jgi:hypothetical protein